MNILIVTQYFWPESFRINDLAAGLVERGHSVTVLTGIPNYPQGTFYDGYSFLKNVSETYNGVKIIRVPLVPRGNATGVKLAVNYLSFLVFASLFAPFICSEKYELIFVFQISPVTVGIPAVFLKKIKKIPILFWVQDLWPETLSAVGAVTSQRLLNGIDKLVRYIYRNSDRILVQSQAFITSVESKRVSPEKILYFPNSVEKYFQPVDHLSDFEGRALLPSGFRLMFAGNIGSAQDFNTILKAAEILRDWKNIHFVILGDGSMFNWVEEKVQQLGIFDNFHLLGRRPAEIMPSYFAEADAMLVTLKREPIFALTIPSKIQSYMACGRPIIAALDGEGGRIIEESGAGLACSAEDPQGLAETILLMYNKSNNERKAMGNRGRIYYQANFEREMLIEKLEVWMQEVILSEKN